MGDYDEQSVDGGDQRERPNRCGFDILLMSNQVEPEKKKGLDAQKCTIGSKGLDGRYVRRYNFLPTGVGVSAITQRKILGVFWSRPHHRGDFGFA